MNLTGESEYTKMLLCSYNMGNNHSEQGSKRMEPLPGWVTTDEAMTISGFSKSGLWKLRQEPAKIQIRKVGRTILYSKAEMEQLAQGKQTWRKREG